MCELEAGSRSVRMKSHKHQVSQEVMLGPGTGLFDFMADKLHHFLQEHELLGQRLSLGFTFSFPTLQRGLARAELANWTKGYVCEGVEGEDVVALLEEAIRRRGDMNIEVGDNDIKPTTPTLIFLPQVDAILNDTTGCLLACAYKRPECAIGIIMGTGE